MVFDPHYGRVRRDYTKANAERDARIVERYNMGVGATFLAEAYGLSRVRIHQIVWAHENMDNLVEVEP